MIRPNSYYEHDEHGRVKVVDVDGLVLYEIVGQTRQIPGMGEIPSGATEPVEAFEERTEPADIEMSMPRTNNESTTPTPGT